jgi:FMN phosphatase YigB (HAD superfamily)
MPFRAVLFDYGNTLLHWMCDAEALRATPAPRGVRVNPDNESGRRRPVHGYRPATGEPLSQLRIRYRRPSSRPSWPAIMVVRVAC